MKKDYYIVSSFIHPETYKVCRRGQKEPFESNFPSTKNLLRSGWITEKKMYKKEDLDINYLGFRGSKQGQAGSKKPKWEVYAGDELIMEFRGVKDELNRELVKRLKVLNNRNDDR